ncbi:MAG: TetR/AcrR family transcriptional regulator [Chloroflexi bacterium]|nr:TetR/AcrR family transcriptional regulator [Chloroflexota bacterium]
MSEASPRQRRREKKINAILDVATSLIVEKGLENVSLRDIAKNADYSPAALYKYFDNKAAIIHAVFNRENQQLIDLLQTVSNDTPPMQKLIVLSLLYIQYCLEHSVYVTLINSVSSGRTSKEQPVDDSSPYLVFFVAVKDWVEGDGIALNQNYGLEEITYSLWALIHGMATLRQSQLKDFDADFESINRHAIEQFLTSLQ